MPDSLPPSLHEIIDRDLDIDVTESRITIIKTSHDPRVIKLERNELIREKKEYEEMVNLNRSARKQLLLFFAGMTVISVSTLLYGSISHEKIAASAGAVFSITTPILGYCTILATNSKIKESLSKIQTISEGIDIAEKRISLIETSNVQNQRYK